MNCFLKKNTVIMHEIIEMTLPSGYSGYAEIKISISLKSNIFI
jgi:hypothetical protein